MRAPDPSVFNREPDDPTTFSWCTFDSESVDPRLPVVAFLGAVGAGKTAFGSMLARIGDNHKDSWHGFGQIERYGWPYISLIEDFDNNGLVVIDTPAENEFRHEFMGKFQTLVSFLAHQATANKELNRNFGVNTFAMILNARDIQINTEDEKTLLDCYETFGIDFLDNLVFVIRSRPYMEINEAGKQVPCGEAEKRKARDSLKQQIHRLFCKVSHDGERRTENPISQVDLARIQTDGFECFFVDSEWDTLKGKPWVALTETQEAEAEVKRFLDHVKGMTKYACLPYHMNPYVGELLDVLESIDHAKMVLKILDDFEEESDGQPLDEYLLRNTKAEERLKETGNAKVQLLYRLRLHTRFLKREFYPQLVNHPNADLLLYSTISYLFDITFRPDPIQLHKESSAQTLQTHSGYTSDSACSSIPSTEDASMDCSEGESLPTRSSEESNHDDMSCLCPEEARIWNAFNALSLEDNDRTETIEPEKIIADLKEELLAMKNKCDEQQSQLDRADEALQRAQVGLEASKQHTDDLNERNKRIRDEDKKSALLKLRDTEDKLKNIEYKLECAVQKEQEQGETHKQQRKRDLRKHEECQKAADIQINRMNNELIEKEDQIKGKHQQIRQHQKEIEDLQKNVEDLQKDNEEIEQYILKLRKEQRRGRSDSAQEVPDSQE